MLDALLNILNGFTNIPFVELAWSHSPDDKYGVISLDNQIALDADADPVSEKMLTGFVDVFVKKPQNLSTVSDVESAMKRLGIWFALNSVQFEDDTGYVHYEWEWKDTTNIVASKLYIVRFRAHGEYVGEPQIVPYGGHPDVPTDEIPDYTEDGITYSPNGTWSPSTEVGVTQNTVYEQTYHAVITLVNSISAIVMVMAKNGDVPFTTDQINILIDWFNNGGRIVCEKRGLPDREVTNITIARVYYDETFSNWYVPEVWIANYKAFKRADIAFTTDEIDYMIDWFNNGGRIAVWSYSGTNGTDASGISTEMIETNNGLVKYPWAV